GRPVTERLEDLPVAMAFGAGVLVGDRIHLFGGREAPDSPDALHTHWRLDLAGKRRWEKLEPDPSGVPRMLSVAGVQHGALYLMGGVGLSPDSRLPGKRVPLTDTWRWSEPEGWSARAQLPRPITAAPSPALALGPHHLIVVGGDAGSVTAPASELREEHPGFAADQLVYSTLTDTWVAMGSFPRTEGTLDGELFTGAWPAVTTPVVPWDGGFVIPSGEVRPCVRTPRVFKLTPRSLAGGFRALDWIVLGVYLAALVAMGFWFSRRHTTTDDFFLAGKRVPWWAAGISIFGTQLSAITFMAIPAKSYDTDWVYFLQNLGIVALAPLVALVYLPFFTRLSVTSAYEYLERRFGLAARLFGSASFILYQLGRMGIVLCLPALALGAVTGLDVMLCIVIMGLLATLYTVLGGIEAVIWTDVLQVFVLLGGAVFVLIAIGSGIDGGLGAVWSEASAAGKFRMVDLDWDLARPTLGVILIGAVFNNLVPYTTDQAVIQRFLTTPDEASARRAIWTNAALTIPASVLFFCLGSALFVFYQHHPAATNPAAKLDEILPWFVANELPAGVAGLVIAGVFAAAMSSLDSSMNSIATAGVTDFYRRFRPAAEDVVCLRLARRLTLLLGVVGTGAAIALAKTDLRSLLDTFLSLMGLLGGCLAGLFALGLFARRTGQTTALIGVAAGSVTLIAVQQGTQLSGLLYAAIGAGTTVLVGWVGSIVRPEPVREGLVFGSGPEPV
ncbi:MAG: sodium/solute symporter, partial [Planctomycetota bacterium]|nr:sodium/solute symporter [Planctomycetota bacterium]